MKRRGRIGLLFAAILAAGSAGYWAGQHAIVPPPLHLDAIPWLRAIRWPRSAPSDAADAAAAASGSVIYYRDPDGLPIYSATPRKTADGRDFLAVRAEENSDLEARSETPESEIKAASPRSGETRKILYYRNPMGLPDTSPVPKKDSMGMDYIPVYAGDVNEEGSVKLTAGKLQRTGVRTERAARRVILRQIRVPGTVQPDERRVSIVSAPTDAFIGKVENVTTGDHVRKGQPLLQIRSSEIAAAAAQAMINPGYEGTRRRLENLNVPPEVVDEIERARAVPLEILWPSPRDGIVLMRNATEGMKVAAGEALFRIADLFIVWVLADVPEYELAEIEPGQTATIRLRSLPGRAFQGRVTQIYPNVAKATRTTQVRIELANPDNLLRPDMYADVAIAAGKSDPVVAVPDSAVIDSGTRQIVLLDKGDGRFEPRTVKIGRQGDGYTEIRDGIAPGDRVVTAANFLIDAESNLKAALSGMTMPEGTP